MKKYIQPNTTTLSLHVSDRLCGGLITSFGSNADLKYGGEAPGGDYKPM